MLSIRRTLLSKLTYANVVATLTLVLVVGGATAYAASGRPSSAEGSSTPAQVKLCAAKRTGELRLLTQGSCRKGERALTISAQGPQGPAGPAGAAGVPGPKGEQGEQGEQGPSGTVTSPDGHFSVTATNDGIALTGPDGTLTFDGTQLATDGSLALTTGTDLALQSGDGVSVSAGSNLIVESAQSTSLTSGAAFSEQAGGTFDQTVGTNYTQSVGNNLSQTVAHNYTQSVGGNLVQSIAQALTLTVQTALSMQGGSAATLSAPSVTLGSGSCAPAARVGSLVDGTLHVTTTGSSTKVFVC